MTRINLAGFWNPKIAAAMGADRACAKKAIDIRKAFKRKGAKKKSPQKRPTKHAAFPQAFHKSVAWRQLRYLALVNCGGRCQCCGASASDGIVLHVDHIKPLAQHPALALTLENLQVLCDDCNIGKGSWDSTDWRDHIKSICQL